MPWLSHTFFCQEGKRSEQLPTMNPNSLALRTIFTVTPPAGSPNSMVPSMSKLMRKANFRPPRAYTAPARLQISHLSHALLNQSCRIGETDEQVRDTTGSRRCSRLPRDGMAPSLVLISPAARQGGQ